MRFYILLILASFCWCLDNGMGLTPPMAWNSWNKFGCKINETLIKQTADAMVKEGYLSAGYNFLNLDDCWAYKRNSTKHIQADPKTFPSGIPSLSQYIHSKGLKFGLYSDAGLKTCAGRPGSLYHQTLDAAVYAQWQVDYLKYDNCYSDEFVYPKQRYARMRDALNKTGRQIYFSMCEWGFRDPWKWAQGYANSWRISPDIKSDWPWIETIIDQLLLVSHYGRPGAWNDPDMLEVGIGNLTLQQQKTHFAIWAITKSPLIIGLDLESARQTSKVILQNKQIIALNQDKLGIPGRLVKPPPFTRRPTVEAIYMPLDNTDIAVVLYNRSKKTTLGGFSYSKIGWPFRSAIIRDLYKHEDLGVYDNEYYALVPGNGVMVFRLRKNVSEQAIVV